MKEMWVQADQNSEGSILEEVCGQLKDEELQYFLPAESYGAFTANTEQVLTINLNGIPKSGCIRFGDAQQGLFDAGSSGVSTHRMDRLLLRPPSTGNSGPIGNETSQRRHDWILFDSVPAKSLHQVDTLEDVCIGVEGALKGILFSSRNPFDLQSS